MADQLPASVQAARAAIKERPPEILILDDDVMTEGELLRAYGVQGPVELVAMDPVTATEQEEPEMPPKPKRKPKPKKKPAPRRKRIPPMCRHGHDLGQPGAIYHWQAKRSNGRVEDKWTCAICKKINMRPNRERTGPTQGELEAEACRIANRLLLMNESLDGPMLEWEKVLLRKKIAVLVDRRDAILRIDRQKKDG